MGVFVRNAAKFGPSSVAGPSDPLARIALGALGLVVCFGLGYQISLRRRRRPVR
jgi:hypothetical protein